MFKKELEIAEELARQAGKRALELQHLGVLRYKDHFEGPLTKGDLEADRIICDGLKKNFPEDLIISEESFDFSVPVPSIGRVWFIDPIDGTSNYAAGGSEYAVMIGLAIDGTPQMGVLFEPSSNTLWRSGPHGAVKVVGSAPALILNIRNRQIPETGLVLAMSHRSPSAFFDFVSQTLPLGKVIHKSSVGLKIALVAEGLADAYVSPGKRIKLWDTCAPAAILKASGGILCSMAGDSLLFSQTIQHGIEIIATTPHAKNRLLLSLQKVIEQWIALKKTNSS